MVNQDDFMMQLFFSTDASSFPQRNFLTFIPPIMNTLMVDWDNLMELFLVFGRGRIVSKSDFLSPTSPTTDLDLSVGGVLDDRAAFLRQYVSFTAASFLSYIPPIATTRDG